MSSGVANQEMHNCNSEQAGDSSGPLCTVRQFCSVYRWPSEPAMRSYIFRAADLGISAAFTRVRRRVLVNPKKFFSLIQEVESSLNQNDRGNYEAKQKR